jgi:hypothetical protein
MQDYNQHTRKESVCVVWNPEHCLHWGTVQA